MSGQYYSASQNYVLFFSIYINGSTHLLLVREGGLLLLLLVLQFLGSILQILKFGLVLEVHLNTLLDHAIVVVTIL